jgi:hypothetical protein
LAKSRSVAESASPVTKVGTSSHRGVIDVEMSSARPRTVRAYLPGQFLPNFVPSCGTHHVMLEGLKKIHLVASREPFCFRWICWVGDRILHPSPCTASPDLLSLVGLSGYNPFVQLTKGDIDRTTLCLQLRASRKILPWLASRFTQKICFPAPRRLRIKGCGVISRE